MDQPRPVRRYLDNAATSWPKPPEVLTAWNRAASEVGATAGRGLYREAIEADSIRDQARRAAAGLLGVTSERVALPAGCTLALNAAIRGLARPGDHVIATAADHNATLRPLHQLATAGIIDWTIVPCDGRGWVDPDDVARAWRPATRLVVCSHVSNVTGTLQDAAAIAAIAHERSGLFLLDAAQSLAVVPAASPGWGSDVLAAPAHKWLLGVGSAAVLWSRPGLDFPPLVAGGTGSASESLAMPEAFAAAHEAGSPDVPALAALVAATAWHEQRGVAVTAAACRQLADDSAAGLGGIPGVRVVGGERAAAIVSFTVEGYDPADVAAILETAAGVQVRAGFHCAACIHEQLGTTAGGTVRAAFGPCNTPADVEAIVETVAKITGG
ncbi:MAG: putative cysteine desulfurase [Planctomycetota bacterium]|jgi:selenocysteine lyase/cysteine desulfurase